MTHLEEQLQSHYGFDSFLPGQKEVVQRILDGQSAAAIFPTGSGKSLCYQLSALLLPHLTLVISPLLSLMKDQLDFLLSHDVAAARLDSTLDKDEQNRVLERARNGDLKILMISVERFKNERFRAQLDRMKFSLLVVDEAHCISEWGHNFRPEYLKIPLYRKEYEIPQVLLLTATATEDVITDMCRELDFPRENVTITGFYRPNLWLDVSPVPPGEKDELLVATMKERPDASTIVYVTLQKTAEKVAETLTEQGFPTTAYHAGMKSDVREEIQNRFMSGETTRVAATIAFGMGIDKSDLRQVIHYDLPKSLENYSQEVGRAGRDGDDAYCRVLASRDNIQILENFVYGDTPSKEAVKALVEMVARHDDSRWEVKLRTLSREVNIRPLPLKTLLVYLELEGIVRPKFSYFADYSLKYIKTPSEIAAQFQGERRDFVEAMWNHSTTKKVWTSVEVDDLVNDYRTDRKRVVAALEYFDEQKWIELQARQTVEVYDLVKRNFSVSEVTDKLAELFARREEREIGRIHHMVAFFEDPQCLTRRLSAYFGEDREVEKCGHCSACDGKAGPIPGDPDLKPLDEWDYSDLTRELVGAADRDLTSVDGARFLCGVASPAFSRWKVWGMEHYGVLERYSFPEVKEWVAENL